MLFLIAAPLLVSIPSPAEAATIFVNCAAHPKGLQPAIDRAPAGATLLITGTCVGNFTVSTSLTLEGRPVDASPVPTLDGDRTGTVLTLVAGHVTVTGLRIWHGAGSNGGGIHVMDLTGDFTTTLTLNASRVARNRAMAGGGILQESGGATLNDSYVVNNHARIGGGVYTLTNITLHGSKVSGNTASYLGGGLYDDFNSSVLLDDSLVSWNRGMNDGGGIYNDDLAQLELIGHTVISHNEASSGGGIFNQGGDVFGGRFVGDPAWTGKVVNNSPDDCFNYNTEVGTILIKCGDK